MSFSIDFIAILQGVTVILIGAGVVGLFQISNRLHRIEQWQIDHEKLDRVREGNIQEQLKALWSRLE